MNDFISSKPAAKSIFKDLVPSKRVIENILNYSKALQVKKTASYGLLVFFNN